VERRIKVLGVSHKSQGLLNFREGINDAGYAAQIIGIISDESIDIIFEDARGCGRTIADRLLDSLKSIRYLDIDPHLMVTHEFGVVPETGLPLSTEVSEEERVDEQARREERWCKGIVQQKFESGLVICGYLHTLSVVFRLRSAGLRVKYDHYLPHDMLCTHDKPF
jgi:hypothetical protein